MRAWHILLVPQSFLMYLTYDVMILVANCDSLLVYPLATFTMAPRHALFLQRHALFPSAMTFFRTRSPMILKLGMKHRGLKLYKVYINDEISYAGQI